MSSITLKNLPTRLHRKLKNRAKEHHRSLNKEIIATLKSATGETLRFDRTKLEESVRRARSLFRRPVTAQEINRWKHEGRLGCRHENMICVDTNIICYRYMSSPHSRAADAAWAKDADWIVPILWRSEFRNALAGSIRGRSLTSEDAIEIANLAELMLGEKEFTVSTFAVLQLVSKSHCSAYDCEFVALAHEQEVQLVTVDQQILREFPQIAVSLDRFVRD